MILGAFARTGQILGCKRMGGCGSAAPRTDGFAAICGAYQRGGACLDGRD